MTQIAAVPPDDVPAIATKRLELVSMTVPFLEAAGVGDVEAARARGGRDRAGVAAGTARAVRPVPARDAAGEPRRRPWLGRALVLTEAGGVRRVIGTVGFHAPPDEAGRLEIGYRVDPAYRRQGYALEAVRGLMDWAAARGVHRFVASISPDNKASLSLAAKLGFERVGEQIDEIDGLEYVFETIWRPEER